MKEKQDYYSKEMQKIIEKNNGDVPERNTPKAIQYSKYDKTIQLIEKIADRQGVSYKPRENYFTKIKKIIKSEKPIVGGHFKDIYNKFKDRFKSLKGKLSEKDLETEVSSSEEKQKTKRSTKKRKFKKLKRKDNFCLKEMQEIRRRNNGKIPTRDTPEGHKYHRYKQVRQAMQNIVDKEPLKYYFANLYDKFNDKLSKFSEKRKEKQKRKELEKSWQKWLDEGKKERKQKIKQRAKNINRIRKERLRKEKTQTSYLANLKDLIKSEKSILKNHFKDVYNKFAKGLESLGKEYFKGELETEVSISEPVAQKPSENYFTKVYDSFMDFLENPFSNEKERKAIFIAQETYGYIGDFMNHSVEQKIKDIEYLRDQKINKIQEKRKLRKLDKILNDLYQERDSLVSNKGNQNLDSEVLISEPGGKKYETDEFKEKPISEQIKITREKINILEKEGNKKKEYNKAKELLTELYEKQRKSWSDYVKNKQSESDEEQKDSNPKTSDL